MQTIKLTSVLAVLVGLAACAADAPPPAMLAEGDYERGPNNGRMLRDGEFAVELAIFETGVPPEFRLWPSLGGAPLALADVDAEVRLTRLGDRVDTIGFEQQGDFLRGDTVVYEPHSFVVSVPARHAGRSYEWQYDSIEGRTRIAADVAEAFAIETATAGPAVIEESIDVYGRIAADPSRVREIRARFDGALRSVDVELGEPVAAGQRLASVESNESLQVYAIEAPIGGVITELASAAGEQTAGRRLFTITDTGRVFAEIAIFPGQRSRVAAGLPVRVAPSAGGIEREGAIARIDVLAGANQAVTARVPLDNADGAFPGMHIAGSIRIAEHAVPLAVRRSGLQSFRDFTVVYAQIGDEYEVRMLDLGRQDREWIEVLGGLEPGTRYVTENSFVIKADIEKSGATHDH